MNKTLTFSVAALVGFGATVALAPDAHAATTAQKALSVAKDQKGDPYKWGATGPNAFDCSGLVKYSYAKVGKSVPRVAQDQYNRSKKVSPSNRKPGDLIFIGKSSGGIYHAGFYAGFWDGYGWILDAPKPGQDVGYHKIKNLTAGSPKAYYGRY